jgi:cbb3-type cytochrome oxidase maturation protein
MSIVFFLIPLGLGLVAIAVWAFVWAVNHDQFEDLDKAAHSILFDDDLHDDDEAPLEQAAPAGDTEEGREPAAARDTRSGRDPEA